MRYLITGGSGQLGFDIYRELILRGEVEVFKPTSKEMNINNIKSVNSYFDIVKPDVVFHCAAYTNVNKAELDGKYDCYMTNVVGTNHIISACKKYGAKLVTISSDYVFDGKKNSPYEVNDDRNPLNVYGRTKMQMEDVVMERYDKYFLVRTSWVFGENGNNFVKTMLNAAKKHDKVNVISDQIGSPSYTPDLAKGLIDLSNTDYYGTYHMTNEDYLSWYEFTKLIYKEAGIDTIVNPIKAKDYAGSSVLRPENSMLSKVSLDQAGIKRLPTVEEATHNFIKVLKK
jgi:dTDP-4-dehydrorhamnose reductase